METVLSSPGIDWKLRYSSPPDNLIKEFYLPAFHRSCRYDRAVGFFSSRLLAMISPALDRFVLNGGKMRLITSPANLSDDDLFAIGSGEQLRSRLQQDLIKAIEQPIPDKIAADRLKLLSWMVAKRKLEVQIALREHDDGYSLFHEKIGIFSDLNGDFMTFSGSPNETVSGATLHSESFPLFRSWIDATQKAYAESERARFEDLWNQRIPTIRTWSATEWLEEPMRKHFGTREPSEIMAMKQQGSKRSLPDIGMEARPCIPSSIKLRDYQRKAINDWLVQRGRGIFAMATGTGKTITALAAATRAVEFSFNRNSSLLVIVIVPLADLVRQWHDEARIFGFRPVICQGGMSRAERDALKKAFSIVRSGANTEVEMIITTADSLAMEPKSGKENFLKAQIARHKGLLLVIGDEMHSLGTKRRLAALPINSDFTLGLSATPKRHGDEEGTEELVKYFGQPVISVSIKQAIYELKALVPYDYFPQFIDLTDVETTEYRAISAKIAAAYSRGGEDAAEIYIRKRARLVQHASNKKHQLRKLLSEGLSEKSHQIVYLAEGRDPRSELHQFDETEKMMVEEFGMTVGRYYGETEGGLRDTLQAQLASGEIQALLAMKCLDEGVDIPSARIGVITSSTQNPRQFVQRRGRILRKDPFNPKSHAEIYDFIVRPPKTERVVISESRLLGMELSRAVELADASRNKEVRFDIIEMAYEYGLDPEQFSWMRLSSEQEMEDLLP